jgi:hypothetical protein
MVVINHRNIPWGPRCAHSSVGRKHTSHLSAPMFVSLRKLMLLLLRNRGIFHEYRSGGIYTIGEIVSHMVFMAINSERHFRSASSYDINEQWRLIEHIDIVVGTDDSKKACQIQRLWETTTLRMIVGCLMPLCKLALPTYWQCIQSMLSNISKNPCSSALASKHWVSVTVGRHKNSFPNHAMMSEQ